jgi:GNAT superfamily N-acetyltransferase
MSAELSRGEYVISTDPDRLDVTAIHAYLTRSYWASGIPRAVVERARVVTDRATFAYLADVYVLEGHRGKGLSKWLVESVLHHPDLQGLRRFLLATRDAHGLYARYGFRPLANPSRIMEILAPAVYGAA